MVDWTKTEDIPQKERGPGSMGKETRICMQNMASMKPGEIRRLPFSEMVASDDMKKTLLKKFQYSAYAAKTRLGVGFTIAQRKGDLYIQRDKEQLPEGG